MVRVLFVRGLAVAHIVQISVRKQFLCYQLLLLVLSNLLFLALVLLLFLLQSFSLLRFRLLILSLFFSLLHNLDFSVLLQFLPLPFKVLIVLEFLLQRGFDLRFLL